jgi:elongation factor Ts
MSILEKVKELRDLTGAGIQDCKTALSENNEDIDLAIEFLRKKGIAKAAKKSSRGATEGLISIAILNNKSSIIEINSETDFVSKNNEFIQFCEKVSNLATEVSSLDELLSKKYDEQDNVSEFLTSLIAKIGENLKIRRFETITDNDNFAFYLHNKQTDKSGNLGVLFNYKSDENEKSKTFANQICMHIAASSPMALDQDGIDNDFIEKERAIIKDQLINEGKKIDMINKIIIGKINKVIQESTLLNQKWVMNPDLSVKKAIDEFNKDNNANFKIKKFIRFKVGEGLEVKKDDFANEVASLSK